MKATVLHPPSQAPPLAPRRGKLECRSSSRFFVAVLGNSVPPVSNETSIVTLFSKIWINAPCCSKKISNVIFFNKWYFKQFKQKSICCIDPYHCLTAARRPNRSKAHFFSWWWWLHWLHGQRFASVLQQVCAWSSLETLIVRVPAQYVLRTRYSRKCAYNMHARGSWLALPGSATRTISVAGACAGVCGA